MNSLPIAIIGAACRFPQAPGIDAFSALLYAGGDAVGEVPPARWARELFYHPAGGQAGKSYTMAAGCIDTIDHFDAGFFAISAREAAHIDPQQRLLLELAWEAMEDAGLPPSQIAGQPVGVFVGGSSWDYATIAAADLSGTDNYSMQGVALSSMSNRLSYQFDLRGPSLTIDTACSSSLVAVHMACEAIRHGEIPAALAGGVNLILAPHAFVGFARATMLSRRGRCQAFDAKADGYVRAEGGGVVLLKPLQDALDDGDAIRGVILASGVNSDGRTNGFSVPSTLAQERLLREVHARAGLEPDDICYLEAHGTGTPVGDPLEANAIGKAIGQHRQTKLPIGSVKTNIGHLEAASGMAGLMKLVIALARREIPASLHFETPNPHIPFAALNLEVVTTPLPIVPGASGLVAGLNSFGFGGTNAHVVLGAAPPPARAAQTPARAEQTPARTAQIKDASASATQDPLPPLLISARAPKALRALAQAWQHNLASLPDEALAPMLRGAARLRDHHPHRLAIPGGQAAAMAASLATWIEQERSTPDAAGPAVAGKLALVFSGNGSQWAGMARDAIAGSAAFRAMLGQVNTVLTPLLGWSVEARLRQPPDPDDLRNTAVAQPMLFAIQVACVAALRQQGVVADACVGHSAGEVAAAWAAGALSLQQAARVIVARSLAQQSRHGAGGMAVLGLGAEEAAPVIARVDRGLALAAINSSRSVTVAGQQSTLARLQSHAETMGWACFPLDIDYPFHSPLMDPIRQTVIDSVAGLAPAIPTTMLVSTVTGNKITKATMDGDYWWRNVREPVRFSDATATLIESGVHLFLEVGPQPVLQSHLLEAIRRSSLPGRVLTTLGRRRQTDPFAAIAARCYVAGCSLQQAAAFEGPATPRGLPFYPWQREHFWNHRSSDGHEIIAPAHDHPLLGYRQSSAPHRWLSHPSTTTERWLGDHVVDGTVVLPAAAMIEMALAAGRAIFPNATSLELRDLEITRTLPLDASAAREVALQCGADGSLLTISSRLRMSADAAATHATAQVLRGAGAGPVFDQTPFSGDIAADGMVEMGAAAIYQAAASLRLSYGPAFRTVRRVLASGSARAVVELDDHGVDRLAEGYLLDPALIDGALQGLIGAAATQALGPERAAVLPWRFGRVRLLRTDGVRPARALVHLRRRGVRSLLADIALLASDGTVVMELLECWFATVYLGAAAEPAERMLWTRLVPSLRQEPGSGADLLDQAMDAVNFEAGQPDSVLLADAMLALAARDALKEPVGAGERHLVTAANPLADNMLRWLEQDGLAQRDGALWRIAETAELPAWPDVWRDLLFEAPSAAGDTALAGAMAGALGTVMADGWTAAPTLPATLIEQMLFASPTGGGALEALLAAVESWLDGWPAGRPLRVAEIGISWRSFTRHVLATLTRRVPSFRYVALAADDDSLAATADALADCPGASAEAWDHAAKHAAFDLVLGLYPFTAPRSRTATAAEAAALLAPGGHLLIIEAAPNRLWQTVFGHAGAPAGIDPPAPATWQTSLETAGCARTRGVVLTGGRLWQAVLIGAWRGNTPGRGRVAGRASLTVFGATDDRLAQAIATGSGNDHTVHELALLQDAAALSALRPALSGRDIAILLPAGMPGDVAAQVDTLASRLARLAACLPVLGNAGHTRIWLVTADPGTAAPTGAAVLGLLRTLANEDPALDCRLLRLDPSLPVDAAARLITTEISAPDDEREVVLSAAGRFVRRLRRGAPLSQPGATGPTRLAVGRPGLLGSLHWERFTPHPPGPGEVSVAVEAAGLIFRDLMWAQGLLPEEALMGGFGGASLGLECAGVVTAVGPGVDDLAPGARVIAVAPAALASEVVTQRRAVIPMPDDMDMAEGTTIPVAFLTAIYALGHLANLQPGERVLIHSGLGSLGLAAIQYALHRGAVVYATAGSVLRRDLLRLLGLAGVFDSRNASFADDLMAATRGEGVDVVLNSLSGELMESGLQMLRPFGRFIEVGKRDLYGNTRLGLRPLRHNIAYYALDADELAAQRPDVAEKVFAEIATLLADGQLRPLPYRRYASDDVVDAFRQLQGSGHIGKIVLTPPHAALPDQQAEPLPAGFDVRADRTYVLSGAIGGFGLKAALFLARHGARHIALLGRRGLSTPGADAALAQLRALGAEARVFGCDVAEVDRLSGTLVRIRAEMPPIGGVIHAAMVLDDGFIGDLDSARFAAVLHAKLGGAEALDRLTRADPVTLFVLFSSITTLLGNPGQANYVAANAAMEAIAERRQAEGLPGLAVTWGPIGDAGYLTRMDRISEALERLLGSAHMQADAALEALPGLLASGVAVCGLADVQWGSLARQLPGLRAPLLAEMPLDGQKETSGRSMRLRLTALAPEEAASAVLQVLVNEIAVILKVDPESVDADQVIAGLGMDSLTSIELRAALEVRLGLEIALSALSSDASLRDIAGRVARVATATAAPTDELMHRILQFEEADDPAFIEAAQ